MSAGLLLAALALDALAGEPEAIWRRVPHPAVVMGRIIGRADAALNAGGMRRAKGAGLMAALVLAAGALGALAQALPGGSVMSVLAAAVLLAQRSLVQHVSRVAAALRLSLPEGRREVSMIVGRDTAALDQAGVARAAIESAAENFSDGVVAPAFWFLVAGLPGILIYKAVNTADSMIGHRSPRHLAFGWAAARLDDALNLIPARLAAGLILLAGGRLAAWQKVPPDARLHASPNAGWPEAAMAVTLGVALAGPRSYDGRTQDFPWVLPEGRRDAGPAQIDAATAVIWRAWGVMALGVAVLAML